MNGRAKLKTSFFTCNIINGINLSFNRGRILEFIVRDNGTIRIIGKEVSFPLNKEDFEKYFTVIDNKEN